MTMLERAARAACAEDYRIVFPTAAPDRVEVYVEEHWRAFRRQATAVIEAIRVPDEAMVAAGISVFHVEGPKGVKVIVTKDTFAKVFSTMVDVGREKADG